MRVATKSSWRSVASSRRMTATRRADRRARGAAGGRCGRAPSFSENPCYGEGCCVSSRRRPGRVSSRAPPIVAKRDETCDSRAISISGSTPEVRTTLSSDAESIAQCNNAVWGDPRGAPLTPPKPGSHSADAGRASDANAPAEQPSRRDRAGHGPGTNRHSDRANGAAEAAPCSRDGYARASNASSRQSRCCRRA
jgi:hypothetical protein